jgi:large subunit ribosomal protein LP2
MKYIAAYLLAYLSGNAAPSAEDLTSTLESGNFISLTPF